MKLQIYIAELLLLLAASCSLSFAPLQEDPPFLATPKTAKATPEELSEAKQKLQSATKKFLQLDGLAKRGSVSKSSLQIAKLEKQTAELELQILENPELETLNRRQIAKLNFEFAQDKHAISKRLFEIGSLSELRYRRDFYQLRQAQTAWKQATGEISEDIAKLQVAQQNFELAKIEFDLANRLFQRRSLSQSAHQRLQERLLQTQKTYEQLRHLQQLRKQKIKDRRKT